MRIEKQGTIPSDHVGEFVEKPRTILQIEKYRNMPLSRDHLLDRSNFQDKIPAVGEEEICRRCF
ncbi:hypothetical protein [Rhizobium sp. WYCCWR 11128]|uniref:hypothetical protein n=1 Tax=Rhizobium sp. WYCCWR 11128 TaxID=2749832 RepID=UPI0015D3829E|nr:hypothetical protein [Rhizobium sp. WYCCWR 11128]NYT35120.1 hypothetical protein [Rhizobium sp. WYCCWR 11128]